MILCPFNREDVKVDTEGYSEWRFFSGQWNIQISLTKTRKGTTVFSFGLKAKNRDKLRFVFFAKDQRQQVILTD